MSSLLGKIVILIYNQSFGTSTISILIDRYNSIIEEAMKIGAFSSLIMTIKTIAIGLTILLFLIDLSEKVTDKNFSTEQFFKSLLRCFTAYLFIMNSDIIVANIMDIGAAIANNTANITSGSDFFSPEHAERKVMLINGLRKLKITDTLSYISYSLIQWIVSMIGEAILHIVFISRILEIIVMTIFAPLAISDIYREGTSSPGIQYLKKMLALSLQVAVMIMINLAAQAIITEVVGDSTGGGMTDLLVSNGVAITPENLANGKAIFTKNSIIRFLDAVLGSKNKLQVMGITLARIGLIWNSLPLCEEITGAK